MRYIYSIVILLTFSMLLLTGCDDKNNEPQTASTEHNAKNTQTKESPIKTTMMEEHEHYACPMHPSEVNNHKANCPICGMYLVKQKEQMLTENKRSEPTSADTASSKKAVEEVEDDKKTVTQAISKPNPYLAFQIKGVR